MKGKILVVDDDEAVGTFVERILTGMGYEVVMAKDAMEAINLLHNQEFHAVITDKNMPGTDHPSEGGLDVLQESKAVNPSCGVLMMTAYATVDSALEAMRMGVFDYINKPFALKRSAARWNESFNCSAALTPSQTLPPTTSCARNSSPFFPNNVTKRTGRKPGNTSWKNPDNSRRRLSRTPQC